MERYAALADDPIGIELSGILARNLVRLNQYAEGLELLDRVLTAAERVGAADIAAEAMMPRGSRSGTRAGCGRRGRCTAAPGSWPRRSAGPTSWRPQRRTCRLKSPSTIHVSRWTSNAQGVDLARRTGRRTFEITTLGNLSEDARRTGDWDWVLDEINAVLTLHPEGNDDGPAPPRDRTWPRIAGSWTRLRSASSCRHSRSITDPDIGIGYQDIRAGAAYAAGRWPEAATIWSEAAA